MQASRIDKFTRSFFWFGFAVFLSASIPHLAAYYRHFDPNSTGWTDIADWVIGYLIAIVIDVTDVLVSIAVLKEMNRGTKQRHLLGYWAFIVFVMALSWLINWQYNIVYSTQAFARADRQQIFGVSVGSVNPIIGSAFQLLILVYTAMAHKFAEKPVQKTAEQLKQEADELEQLAKQQARIDTVKRAQNANKIGGIFDTISQAKERAKELFSTSQSEAFEPDKADQIEEPKEDEIERQNKVQRESFIEPNSGEIKAINDDVLEVLKRFPKIEPLLSSGRSTFSIEEVSAATGHGERMLANRIANKALKRHPRNEKLMYKDSLVQWLKTAPAARQTDDQNGKIVSFNTSANEELLNLVN